MFRRTLFGWLLLVVPCSVGAQVSPAQDAVPPEAAKQAPVPAASFAAVELDVMPLKEVDLSSPYASPRDAARHRLRVTLDKLKADQNLAEGLRGMEQAVAIDPDYFVAVYNLGVACAIAEKWDDAIWALTEAVRLNSSVKARVDLELERLRLIGSMDATPDGARRRKYNTVLASTLPVLRSQTPAQAITTLTEVAKIDPGRWETPALIAGYAGDSGEYETAAKFLAIAIERAGKTEGEPKLREAGVAAQREVGYATKVSLADNQYAAGKWAESAQSYEAAWGIFPGRTTNALQAGTAWLLADNTAGAVTVLSTLSLSTDIVPAQKAQAMLLALKTIETAPAASSTKPGTDGSVATRISVLLPEVRTPEMTILLREPLRFEQDESPIRTFEALSMDPAIAGRAATTPLPEPASPTLPGTSPMRELAALRQRSTTPSAFLQTVSRTTAGMVVRDVRIATSPAGASVFAGEEIQPACVTPCLLQTSSASPKIRLEASGYQPVAKSVAFSKGLSTAEITLTLDPIRGHVIVQEPALVSVNGQPINIPTPFEISLLPGLYEFEIKVADHSRHIPLVVRPDSRLRLPVDPF